MQHTISGMARTLAVFTAACGCIAVPAAAQTPSATLIKNLDEKGRKPYMEHQDMVCNKGPVCELSFPPIPTGKRLVVEHVNAGIGIPTGGVRFTSLVTQGSNQCLLPARQVADPTLQIVNEPLLVYFESGEAPIFRVNLTSTATVAFVSSTVTGYLIDLAR